MLARSLARPLNSLAAKMEARKVSLLKPLASSCDCEDARWLGLSDAAHALARLCLYGARAGEFLFVRLCVCVKYKLGSAASSATELEGRAGGAGGATEARAELRRRGRELAARSPFASDLAPAGRPSSISLRCQPTEHYVSRWHPLVSSPIECQWNRRKTSWQRCWRCTAVAAAAAVAVAAVVAATTTTTITN